MDVLYLIQPGQPSDCNIRNLIIKQPWEYRNKTYYLKCGHHI
jgi:hypothetical protein